MRRESEAKEPAQRVAQNAVPGKILKSQLCSDIIEQIEPQAHF